MRAFKISRPLGHWLLRCLAAVPLAPAASACKPPDPTRVPEDRSVMSWFNGSFQDTSSDHPWWQLEGRPVRGVGVGRVGQVPCFHDCCWREALLAMDDTTSSTILVYAPGGGPDPMTELSGTAPALQPSHDPWAPPPPSPWQRSQRWPREGWQVRTDVPTLPRNGGPQNAFNPFTGCEIFYPGSVRAGQ